MGTDHFILILSAEALIVCLVITGLALIKNRKLRKLVDQLQARIRELSEHCKKLVTPPAAPSLSPSRSSYSDQVDEQITLTREFHRGLGAQQDIALDLDPDAPQDRRTAALRNAFLIAEKEATTTDKAVDWNLLSNRYVQLLSFHADYAQSADTGVHEALEQTEHNLHLARKRINNLERFKAMYFELEERWQHCRGQADLHYSELQALAASSAEESALNRLLDAYQASYGDIDAIIAAGLRDPQNEPADPSADSQLHELRRLRNVAAEQHRIISELQSRLSLGLEPADQAVILESLHSELKKQSRFLQESETCIKLMEDELSNANRQLEHLRSRADQAAQLRAQAQALQEKVDSSKEEVDALQQENRRLSRELRLAQEAPPEDNPEAQVLRKQVAALQNKYNDLEEKFLDLKLKQ